MVFALCGGDERIVRLAGMLLADGHGVKVWALEGAQLPDGARACDSAAECVLDADCVVLPMPASVRRGLLNAPLSKKTHCMGEIFAAVAPGTPVCAGGVGADVRAMAG